MSVRSRRPLGYRSTRIDTLPTNVPERVFQRQVLELAALMGWEWWHDDATNTARKCDRCGELVKRRRNAKGWPDLLLFRGPRLVVAELKSATGKVATEQEAWLARFRLIPGAEVYVWRPDDMGEIVRILSR